MPCPLPRRTRRVRASVASPSALPSPHISRVGVRVFTFEACSGFTHVTACRIAQSPKATFVTRLRPGGLPLRLVSYQLNRQLAGWNLPPLVDRALRAHCYVRALAAERRGVRHDEGRGVACSCNQARGART